MFESFEAMIKRLISLAVFGFLILNTGNSQSSNYKRLAKEWNDFLQADDNEKDYRTNLFLTTLEQTIEKEKPTAPISQFLKGWKTANIGDAYAVYVAHVSFEIRPDRVFYCLRDNQNNKAYAFSKEIGTKVLNGNLNVEGRQAESGKDTLFIAEFASGSETIFTIPDLKSVFLLTKLSRSRGDDAVFVLTDSLMERIELVMKDSHFFKDNFVGFEGLSTLISSDDKVKIVTWNTEETTGIHHFFGLVGVKDDDNKVRVFRLKDSRDKIPLPEFSTLTASKWYGAVYYDIIPVKYRGNMYYTLLGYNGNNAFSRIRVVEIVSLSKNGSLKFGASMFDIKGRTKRRLVYEYSNQANMMLRYDDKAELIVMDHLAPMDQMYTGDRSYYGPDFSYDALEFKKGKWVLLENVELRNR